MSAKKFARRLRSEISSDTYKNRDDLINELHRNNYHTIINRRFSLAFKDEENHWHTINGLGGRFEYIKEPKIRSSKRIALLSIDSCMDGALNLENLSEEDAFIYALVSLTPKGDIGAYIGQTVNLNRRINEHLNNIHPRWSFYLHQWSEQKQADTYMIVLEHLPDKQMANLMEFVWVKTAEKDNITLPEVSRWGMRARKNNKQPYPERKWINKDWIKQHGILLIKRSL